MPLARSPARPWASAVAGRAQGVHVRRSVLFRPRAPRGDAVISPSLLGEARPAASLGPSRAGTRRFEPATPATRRPRRLAVRTPPDPADPRPPPRSGRRARAAVMFDRFRGVLPAGVGEHALPGAVHQPRARRHRLPEVHHLGDGHEGPAQVNLTSRLHRPDVARLPEIHTNLGPERYEEASPVHRLVVLKATVAQFSATSSSPCATRSAEVVRAPETPWRISRIVLEDAALTRRVVRGGVLARHRGGGVAAGRRALRVRGAPLGRKSAKPPSGDGGRCPSVARPFRRPLQVRGARARRARARIPAAREQSGALQVQERHVPPGRELRMPSALTRERCEGRARAKSRTPFLTAPHTRAFTTVDGVALEAHVLAFTTRHVETPLSSSRVPNLCLYSGVGGIRLSTSFQGRSAACRARPGAKYPSANTGHPLRRHLHASA